MATNKPPAGTATHNHATCRCFQCKAKRYDLLLTERDALKTERDGLAADLKVITTEANIQREAADKAKADIELLAKQMAEMEIDLNTTRAANEKLLAANRGLAIEGRRNARLVPILGSILLFAGLTWLALWIQSMGGSK